MSRFVRTLMAVAAGGVVVAAATGLYSRFVHPFRPRTNHVMVKLPREHASLAGMTITFVTDTHVGPHFPRADLTPIVQIVARTEPDIVIFGGDFISESPRFFDHVREPLRLMAMQGKLGAWGIWGNHDIANIRARAQAMLDHTGIVMLENESAGIPTEKGTLWLVGIDDALLGRPDLDAAWRDVPPGAPVIALWHEPDLAERVVPYDPMILLSGHTHGGQVRLPILGPIATPKLGKRYVTGRFDIDGMPLFVSNGIGMYRPPVRFNCPAEVVVLHLIAP